MVERFVDVIVCRCIPEGLDGNLEINVAAV